MNNDVSSAKSLALHFKSFVRSFIYTRKDKGPRIEPLGTPAEISPQEEFCPFKTLRCFLSLRKLLIRARRFPETRHRFSLKIRPSWQTLSNALEISSYTDRTSQGGLQSNASKVVWIMEINWSTVESPGRKPD